MINEVYTASVSDDLIRRNDVTTVDVEKCEKTVNDVVAKAVNAASAVVPGNEVQAYIDSSIAVLENMHFSSRVALER